MHSMKHFLFAFGFLYCSFFSFSQQNKIDSLQKLLQKAKHDTTRLHLYLKLGEFCDTKDNLKYAEPALQLADKLLSQTKDKTQRKILLARKAGAYDLCFIYYNEDETKNLNKVIEYKEKALELYKEIDNKKEVAGNLQFLGECYGALGNYLKELDFFKKSLIISEELKDQGAIAGINFSIGSVYFSQKDTILALSHFEKSLEAFKNLRDSSKMAILLVKIGSIYEWKKKHSKANTLINEGLDLIKTEKNHLRLAMSYSFFGQMLMDAKLYDKALENFNVSYELIKGHDTASFGGLFNALGKCYFWTDNFTKAIEYYNRALKMAQLQKNESMEAQSLIGLANAYLKLHKNKEAADYARRALPLRKKEGLPVGLMYAEKIMFRADSSIGDFKGAFEHLSNYIILRDKLNGDDVRKEGLKQKFKEDFDKEKEEARLIQEKKDIFDLEEKKKQRIILFSVIGGLLLLLAFSVFVLRNLRTTRKQKQIIELKSKETEEQKIIIEEKNKDITDSINYAKRIQQAKLPRKEEIYTALPQSFVLFKPKDIVSGDFYFFAKKGSLIFIAAADCTGHGVPGAFMSMIGSERLEDAVANSNDTSEILQLLNKGIKTSLRQSDSDESTRDGMDIALCSVDTKTNLVKYAGANRPIWLIRKGQTEVEEIKATKKAIGGLTEDAQYFDTHEIQLEQGDSFYITTDGYADLFSRDDKKLTTKKFKQILLEIQDKPMQEQEKQLSDFAENWSNGIEQIDDILVIGVRL